MTAVKETESFARAVVAQQEINRITHGDEESDEKRLPMEWGVIASEHMGHLLGALRTDDDQAIEKELLHVAGPLVELWNSIKNQTRETYLYTCGSCHRKLSLQPGVLRCPLCEGMLTSEGQ